MNNIYLAFLGYALIIIMIVGLLKKKLIPVVAFAILPPIFGLLAGFSIFELSDFVVEGVAGTVNSAALCLFATLYFCIVTDIGLFDPLVNFLSKKAGGNIVAITVITTLISAVSHLETGMTATMLITIPAMLPLYKRFGIRREILFLLIAQSVAVINMLPHGGGMIRIAGVTGLDVADIFANIAPIIVIMMIYNIIFAVLIGRKEKRRIAKSNDEAADYEVDLSRKKEMKSVKINFVYFLNLFVTIAIIVLMFFNVIRSYFIFMMGVGLILIINYKDIKDQNDAIKKHAASAYNIGIIMLASGILVGIMSGTGMLTQMANVIILLIPDFLKQVFGIIVGFLSIPLSLALGADGFYYGLTPLFTQIGTTYGIPVLSIASIMIIARDAVGCLTPVSAVSYLAPGLLDLELKDLIKFSFKYLFLFFCIEMVLAVLLGIVPIG